MGRNLKIAVLTLAVLGAVIFFLAMKDRRSPPPSQWNVLWIVIDDLKADHLGVAGYDRDITPSLDRLARSGARFDWCVTQAPWSLPSYASMFTSRYPSELVLGPDYLKHVRAETEIARSRDPLRMPAFNTYWYEAIRPGAPAIAGWLRERGFATAAWVNNAWLSPGSYGLEAGFQSYFDGAANHSPYTPADETADLAVKWIGEHASSRWFAFVHFMDPHRPYHPHPGLDFGTRFLDLYDAEIAFTDRAVGEIMDELDRRGLRDHTIIVINADHGEGVFAEDARFIGHGGGVIPEIVRVPLIVSWPGSPKGRVMTALCRNLDIMPTILDLLQIPGPEGMRGRSLLPEIKRKAKTSPEPAFTMAVLKGPEQVSAIIQGDEPGQIYQAVVIPAYQEASVYTIIADGLTPGAPPEATAMLMEDLKKFLAEAEQAVATAQHGASPALDEKTIANLRALGYLK